MLYLLAIQAMLSSLLLTLATCLSVTQGPATLQDPLASLDALLQAEETAYQQWAEDRPERSVRTLAEAIRRAADVFLSPVSRK